ncbi:MAG: sulfite exporter TauE/SafE family protein, partial [Anaerolineae bacterium]
GKAIPRDEQATGLAKKLQSIPLGPMIYLPTSRIVVSFWTVSVIGAFTGFLSGFFGVGGGFVRVPAMIYLLGMPSLIAVGTDLFSIIISSGYATIRHGMSHNVVIFAAFIMIFGAAIGAQIGALGTAYVRGPGIRLILAVAVTIGAAGAAVKLADVLTDESIMLLDIGSKVITFGGMGVLVSLIIGLVGMAIVLQRGRIAAPSWAETLIVVH